MAEKAACSRMVVLTLPGVTECAISDQISILGRGRSVPALYAKYHMVMFWSSADDIR